MLHVQQLGSGRPLVMLHGLLIASVSLLRCAATNSQVRAVLLVNGRRRTRA